LTAAPLRAKVRSHRRPRAHVLRLPPLAPRPDPAFRSYRLTLGAIVFGLIALAVTWLASSVGVALFVHPKLPAAARFSGSRDDLQAMLACEGDVRALLDELAVKRAPDDKGAWQAVVDEAWQRRWEEVGARCRFEELRDKGLGEAYDHVAWAHAELPEVH